MTRKDPKRHFDPNFPRSIPRNWRFPFEVRRVDRMRRRYILVDTVYGYHDACIVADAACCYTKEHHIVWDTLEERVLYDSRLIK